jgi:cytochrome oxidase assembly protein ShyY1
MADDGAEALDVLAPLAQRRAGVLVLVHDGLVTDEVRDPMQRTKERPEPVKGFETLYARI